MWPRYSLIPQRSGGLAGANGPISKKDAKRIIIIHHLATAGDKMTLAELAFGCYVYSQLTSFDRSYLVFLKATDHKPDMTRAHHRKALLVWLNSWGCRQFALDDHERASQAILAWQKEIRLTLPNVRSKLSQLADDELAEAQKLYDSLECRTASLRKKGSGKIAVRFGPTGASKALFALRPGVFVPWDEPIRKWFHDHGQTVNYSGFLKYVRAEILKLDHTCRKHGFTVDNLPEQLNRPKSTVVKLFDEYYWTMITRECSMPSEGDFSRWKLWTTW